MTAHPKTGWLNHESPSFVNVLDILARSIIVRCGDVSKETVLPSHDAPRGHALRFEEVLSENGRLLWILEMASISSVAKREYGQVPTFHQSIDLRIKTYTKDAPGFLYFRTCRLAMTLVLPNGRHSIGAMHLLQGRALRSCPATLASSYR